jgi:hypothetical protein
MLATMSFPPPVASESGTTRRKLLYAEDLGKLDNVQVHGLQLAKVTLIQHFADITSTAGSAAHFA